MYQSETQSSSSSSSSSDGLLISDWMVTSMIVALSVIALWTICIGVLTGFIIRVYCKKRADRKSNTGRNGRRYTNAQSKDSEDSIAIERPSSPTHVTHVTQDTIGICVDVISRQNTGNGVHEEGNNGNGIHEASHRDRDIGSDRDRIVHRDDALTPSKVSTMNPRRSSRIVVPNQKRPSLPLVQSLKLKDSAQEIQKQMEQHLTILPMETNQSASSTLNTMQLVHAAIHVAEDDPYGDDSDSDDDMKDGEKVVQNMINPNNNSKRSKAMVEEDRALPAFHTNTLVRDSELTPEPSPMPNVMELQQILERQHTIVSDRYNHYPAIPSTMGPGNKEEQRHIPGSPASSGMSSGMYSNHDATPDGYVVDRQGGPIPKFVTNHLPRYNSSSNNGYQKINRM